MCALAIRKPKHVPRLDEDLLPLLLACVEGRLPERPVRLLPLTALSVVLAAKAIQAPRSGEAKFLGLRVPRPCPSFDHPCRDETRSGKTRRDGGRVLNVTGIGADVAEARARAYAAIDMIDWPGGFYRRDIGWRALKTTLKRA